jgi:hypothetical protein
MNTFNVSELLKFLDQIFDLQNKLLAKDLEIMNLEFELALKKQMLDAFNRVQVKGESHDS